MVTKFWEIGKSIGFTGASNLYIEASFESFGFAMSKVFASEKERCLLIISFSKVTISRDYESYNFTTYKARSTGCKTKQRGQPIKEAHCKIGELTQQLS